MGMGRYNKDKHQGIIASSNYMIMGGGGGVRSCKESIIQSDSTAWSSAHVS